jgi:hypothetical protein
VLQAPERAGGDDRSNRVCPPAAAKRTLRGRRAQQLRSPATALWTRRATSNSANVEPLRPHIKMGYEDSVYLAKLAEQAERYEGKHVSDEL